MRDVMTTEERVQQSVRMQTLQLWTIAEVWSAPGRRRALGCHDDPVKSLTERVTRGLLSLQGKSSRQQTPPEQLLRPPVLPPSGGERERLHTEHTPASWCLWNPETLAAESARERDGRKRYKQPLLKGTRTEADKCLRSGIPQERAGPVPDQNLCRP